MFAPNHKVLWRAELRLHDTFLELESGSFYRNLFNCPKYIGSIPLFFFFCCRGWSLNQICHFTLLLYILLSIPAWMYTPRPLFWHSVFVLPLLLFPVFDGSPDVLHHGISLACDHQFSLFRFSSFSSWGESNTHCEPMCYLVTSVESVSWLTVGKECSQEPASLDGG